MNFGTCSTPDCTYRSEPDSDWCLLCNYVSQQQETLRELQWQADEFGRALFELKQEAA
jgi:hypothetical protein